MSRPPIILVATKSSHAGALPPYTIPDPSNTLGFFLFSVASLRTAVLSRTVGFLLLVPTVAWVGLIVGNVVAPSGDYLGVLAYTPISIALLAIGYLLRGEPSPTDRAGPASDTVA